MHEGLPDLGREPLSGSKVFAVEFDERHNVIWMVDQLQLPEEVVSIKITRVAEVAEAIKRMNVRGAPAIGLAAAYGLSLVAFEQSGDKRAFLTAVDAAGRLLGRTRPTAVNLGWAIAEMTKKGSQVASMPPAERAGVMLAHAKKLHVEDAAACRKMAEFAADDMRSKSTILTHCNTGALATGGIGTALGAIRIAHAHDKSIRVLANETRPYLQGARLTAWELQQDGIGVEVLTDAMAGHFMQRGEIDFVIVGSDRIAANGDVANKIGTYSLAVLARAHRIPFAVAAPWSTVDLDTPDGDAIPIEERSADEVAIIGGKRVVAKGVRCRHPAFDVTPAKLVSAVYTERGVFRPRQGETPALLST